MNTMFKLRLKPHQSGLTLLEILLALFISTFVLSGMIFLFINIKQIYRLQVGYSRIQENAGLAMQLLGRDIRMTGYWGCLQASTGDLYGDDTQLILKAAYIVEPPVDTCGEVVNKEAMYYLDKTATITYTIVNDVLRRHTNNLNNDVVEGIEGFLIGYGVDSDADGTPNYYVYDGAVIDFEHVVSLHVSLEVSSLDDNLLDTPITTTFKGVTKTDRRLRRIVTSTFMLRNRSI